MSTLIENCPAEPIADQSVPALRIEAHQVTRVLRNGTPTLADVSLTIEPGQLVAIIGASGAGKTTLVETLSGVRLATSGRVCFDGCDIHENREAFRGVVGYVPQDDIIHRELPLRATIRHAAELRLPHLGGVELDHLVDCTIATLGLSEHASTTVGRLSGGQRKRVSIAVELLTRPRAFFLDEPTSGLDPGTARNLLTTLRTLAGNGSTIVLTTHSPDDVVQCDQVIVVGRGGRVLFQGTPAQALQEFGVIDIASVYRCLEDQPETIPARRPSSPSEPPPSPPAEPPTNAPAARASIARQWNVLRRRNVEVLVRNRLTLAIMLGAPALVIGMFVILFRPSAFDAQGTDPLAAVGVTYWLAFAAFFFGLTYGLLQIVTEIAVVRRERHVGLDMGPYLLAKLTVLVPVLLVVNVAMVAALQATGRLPADSWATTARLVFVLLLDAVVALDARAPGVGGGLGGVPRHPRAAAAVLPRRPVRRRRPPGAGHGDHRPSHQHHDAGPLGVRRAGPCPRTHHPVRRRSRRHRLAAVRQRLRRLDRRPGRAAGALRRSVPGRRRRRPPPPHRSGLIPRQAQEPCSLARFHSRPDMEATASSVRPVWRSSAMARRSGRTRA